MNIYTQAVSERKREANSKVVEMVFRRPSNVDDAAEKVKKKASSTNGSDNGSQMKPGCSSRNRLHVIDAVELEDGCGGWI